MWLCVVVRLSVLALCQTGDLSGCLMVAGIGSSPTPHDPDKDKWKWMDGWSCSSFPSYQTSNVLICVAFLPNIDILSCFNGKWTAWDPPPKKKILKKKKLYYFPVQIKCLRLTLLRSCFWLDHPFKLYSHRINNKGKHFLTSYTFIGEQLL